LRTYSANFAQIMHGHSSSLGASKNSLDFRFFFAYASGGWEKGISGMAATAATALSALPPPRPWTLPAQGLAVFHGGGETARLSHYFLPRLLLQGKRVLMLDGANCADPRLMERLARQRGVPFEQFSRQIQIARAFTCFQLTELIARVPRLLADFPAQVLIVTAFPELYYDEDVRDWNARVAFEQALENLRRWVSAGSSRSAGLQPGMAGAGLPIESGQVPAGAPPPLAVALFSSATTFIPSPARQRFFERTCGAAAEVWKFSMEAGGRLQLKYTRPVAGLKEVTSNEHCVIGSLRD
jgi:hypothetical protein